MEPKYKGKDQFYHTSTKEYTISKCVSCWLEKIDPTPSRQEQSSFYPQNYYSYQLTKKNDNHKTIFHKIYDRILKKLENKTFTLSYFSLIKEENMSYLDIGCWDGMTLKLMKDSGWEVSWFEFSQDHKKIWDIYYWPSIVDVDFHNKKFDVIYMSHVFEHIDDPAGYLRKIKQISHKDSKIMIILPNTACLSSYLWWVYAAHRDIPRHLYNYNYHNFTTLVESFWFNIIKAWVLPNWWSTMSCSWMFADRRWIRISGWKNILFIVPVFFDIIMSTIKNSNQMWFVISPK